MATVIVLVHFGKNPGIIWVNSSGRWALYEYDAYEGGRVPCSCVVYVCFA